MRRTCHSSHNELRCALVELTASPRRDHSVPTSSPHVKNLHLQKSMVHLDQRALGWKVLGTRIPPISYASAFSTCARCLACNRWYAVIDLASHALGRPLDTESGPANDTNSTLSFAAARKEIAHRSSHEDSLVLLWSQIVERILQPRTFRAGCVGPTYVDSPATSHDDSLSVPRNDLLDKLAHHAHTVDPLTFTITTP